MKGNKFRFLLFKLDGGQRKSFFFLLSSRKMRGFFPVLLFLWWCTWTFSGSDGAAQLLLPSLRNLYLFRIQKSLISSLIVILACSLGSACGKAETHRKMVLLDGRGRQSVEAAPVPQTASRRWYCSLWEGNITTSTSCQGKEMVISLLLVFTWLHTSCTVIL